MISQKHPLKSKESKIVFCQNSLFLGVGKLGIQCRRRRSRKETRELKLE